MLFEAGIFSIFSAVLLIPSTGWRTEFVDGSCKGEKRLI
jgi:hypothetical protein